MKIRKRDWPILLVSGQFDMQNDEGYRLRELEQELVEVQKCVVLRSASYEDAVDIVHSRADLGAVVMDWDMPLEKINECNVPETLLEAIRERNSEIPVFLLTDRVSMSAISTGVLACVNECLWKTMDTSEFLAGRVDTLLQQYVQKVYPIFFAGLVEYSEKYKYAWHTPGHMGGEGFLKSPAGVGFHKFFGENVFRADLSISVPELGSLLDHSGVTGDAEKNSARVFGADITFYVLNGTSNANQIIWRSKVVRDDIAFVDRNCHKSLNYAMVITDAYPIYMQPRRNHLGIIGPCRLSEFTQREITRKIVENGLIPDESKQKHPAMSALTNSTYDGVCYNVQTIKKELKKSVHALHFDEAWYAYARFHPMYASHYGMVDSDKKHDHPPVFCSQSTHKLLTAFSQSSMLHVKHGSHDHISADELNESYMMHGSTSPQYSMIASLDVATKMMEDSGRILLKDCIYDAILLRQKIASIHREMKAADSWFFNMWQPETIEYNDEQKAFVDVPVEYLAEHQKPWVFSRENNWHGFDDIENKYAMLDPIKLTITTPGVRFDGTTTSMGIPAAVVSDYLITHGIVCEKTDYYSFLLLNSIGTTKAKQGTLLSALLKFKECYDRNVPLREALPDLAAAYPHKYADVGLQEHCNALHAYYVHNDLLGKMHRAFEVLPEQAMKPSDAYHHVIKKNVEPVALREAAGRTAAVMLVPYPPGIPILMGGEKINETAAPILEYLLARETFENTFPGYESDIHGVERITKEGNTYFTTLCIKQ